MTTYKGNPYATALHHSPRSRRCHRGQTDRGGFQFSPSNKNINK